MPISTTVLRDSLATTAAIARSWFEDCAEIKTRKQFEARGELGDAGLGAVYVYFSEKGKAVYVGETGRKVKARLHDEMSPHKSKDWWSSWSYMRFVALECDVDRLVIESLLIAIYEPGGNIKPKAKNIGSLFPL
ncbi:GIY-YIG nuclease family protein [Pseudomonas sp. BGI-2]|uniref:GIY-YIG nuclease family protein n=1 Tax=Pseudomonas sp. BGI-2 TaxID=2528211 RepID=UPI001033C86D|nr:GIY-YIG nuclease family protein [Pseudomonas sp. BGI-2]TBN36132.1 GIY-YIG nuclease family protein [Pseudomonas sp. BGI-2]